MTTRLTLLLALLGLAWHVPAWSSRLVENAGQPRTCEGRHLANVGSLYFSIPEQPDPGAEARTTRPYRVRIDNAGSVTIDGSAISDVELSTSISKISSESFKEVQIIPSARFSFGSVVMVFRALNDIKICTVGIVGNEQYLLAFDHRAISPNRVEMPPIQPFSNPPTNIHILVDFKPTPSKANSKRARRSHLETGCRAYVDGVEMDTFGLQDELWKRADGIRQIWLGEESEVKRNEIFPPTLYGGNSITAQEVKARNLNLPDAFNSATISASSKTPWMCVASAVYAAQISGLEVVDFVLID